MNKGHTYGILLRYYNADAPTPRNDLRYINILYVNRRDNTTYHYYAYLPSAGKVSYMSNKRIYSTDTDIVKLSRSNPRLGKLEGGFSHKRPLTKKQLIKTIESYISKYTITRNGND